MKVVKVILSDEREITVREPYAKEFPAFRNGLKHIQDLAGLTDMGDDRFDVITESGVMEVVALLADLPAEELPELAFSDYLGLLMAVVQVSTDTIKDTDTNKPTDL